MAVTPETIAVALGRTAELSVPEYVQWEMWISDAKMLIDARKTALGILTTLDVTKLDYVVREAVVAHVRRPDDATQVTVAIQDASTSRTYQSSKGRIVILDEWWTLLGLTAPTGGAWSIDTASGTGVHDTLCTLNFGGLYCSCGADLTRYAFPLFESEPGAMPGEYGYML